MNKNSKRRQKLARQDGKLVKYVLKKKAKPFPQPKDAGLSLATQRDIFFGVR